MSRIKISNFGPIHTPANESEAWIDVKKVTVFIGDQGCGKSTIAKLISLCCWMEKVLARETSIKRCSRLRSLGTTIVAIIE